MNIKGIDISKHQGRINWDKVKADGVQFAMIRMGYGLAYEDEYFERNVKECERVGIPWGAYLYSYALNVEQAKQEAVFALKLLKGKNPTYPIAFDMEDADQYKKKHGMPSNAVLVDMCHAFLDVVENSGYYVSLYASLHWLNTKLNSSKLNRFDKWVAQWSDKCTYKGSFQMWQYTSSGSVDGISGRVDMNYAYRDFPSHYNPKKEEKPKEQPKDKVQHVSNQVKSHVVKAGDNLTKIANKYGTTVAVLVQLNNIKNKDLIYPGQKIKLPNGSASKTSKKYHTVERGDTVSALANKYGSAWSQIKSWNKLDSNYTIYPGQKLRVK
ncbi:glycoside hydrolase family 25 protein [Ornithinibacillus xuwenensis]|uniref:GH25 family lysozyme n=1 Tax=Ornithinibacillus xuwenensis TaxID=3144668 RepID=A0ABU9XD65_9BACI